MKCCQIEFLPHFKKTSCYDFTYVEVRGYWGLCLSFHPVDSRDRAPVIRLGTKPLLPTEPSHLRHTGFNAVENWNSVEFSADPFDQVQACTS